MERDMKVYLKIKIRSLAAEARIIRAEEKKWPGDSTPRLGLYRHRIREVRTESRTALVAYGFLRGRPYRQLEPKARRSPNWERVQRLIEKYGTGEPQLLRQRFAEWKDAAT
jgi:hypothetical protein